MISFRYHLVSLVAVFLALAVGHRRRHHRAQRPDHQRPAPPGRRAEEGPRRPRRPGQDAAGPGRRRRPVRVHLRRAARRRHAEGPVGADRRAARHQRRACSTASATSSPPPARRSPAGSSCPTSYIDPGQADAASARWPPGRRGRSDSPCPRPATRACCGGALLAFVLLGNGQATDLKTGAERVLRAAHDQLRPVRHRAGEEHRRARQRRARRTTTTPAAPNSTS